MGVFCAHFLFDRGGSDKSFQAHGKDAVEGAAGSLSPEVYPFPCCCPVTSRYSPRAFGAATDRAGRAQAPLSSDSLVGGGS